MTQNKTERAILVGFLGVVTDHLQQHGASIEDFRLLLNSGFDGYPIRGIRQATNDFIEWTSDFSEEALAELDNDLSARNLPTMTAMRDRSYRKAQVAISRRRISNDTEWYLLNGLISQVDGSSLSRDERTIAEDLVARYTPAQTDEEKQPET